MGLQDQNLNLNDPVAIRAGRGGRGTHTAEPDPVAGRPGRSHLCSGVRCPAVSILLVSKRSQEWLGHTCLFLGMAIQDRGVGSLAQPGTVRPCCVKTPPNQSIKAAEAGVTHTGGAPHFKFLSEPYLAFWRVGKASCARAVHKDITHRTSQKKAGMFSPASVESSPQKVE